MLEYREVMHLQCFPTMFYARQVKGEAIPVIEANVIERTVRCYPTHTGNEVSSCGRCHRTALKVHFGSFVHQKKVWGGTVLHKIWRKNRIFSTINCMHTRSFSPGYFNYT